MKNIFKDNWGKKARLLAQHLRPARKAFALGIFVTAPKVQSLRIAKEKLRHFLLPRGKKTSVGRNAPPDTGTDLIP